VFWISGLSHTHRYIRPVLVNSGGAGDESSVGWPLSELTNANEDLEDSVG